MRFLIFAKMDNTPHKDIDDFTKFSQAIADFGFEEGYKKGYDRAEQVRRNNNVSQYQLYN